MKKDLYHGSSKILKKPIYGFGTTENVSLRTLQHYEQGSKDLRHAAGETLLALARTLGTTVEGLIL